VATSFQRVATGGGQCAIADGSVRFVRQSIGLAQYRAAATRAGGEVTNLD